MTHGRAGKKYHSQPKSAQQALCITRMQIPWVVLTGKALANKVKGHRPDEARRHHLQGEASNPQPSKAARKPSMSIRVRTRCIVTPLPGEVMSSSLGKDAHHSPHLIILNKETASHFTIIICSSLRQEFYKY